MNILLKLSEVGLASMFQVLNLDDIICNIAKFSKQPNYAQYCMYKYLKDLSVVWNVKAVVNAGHCLKQATQRLSTALLQSELLRGAIAKAVTRFPSNFLSSVQEMKI